MAENEDGQERTEQPSEKRLREAREQGQIPRSPELATAAVFGLAMLTLLGFGGAMAAGAARWMRQALSFAGVAAGDGHALTARFGELALALLLVVAPLFAACVLAAFVAPVVMGGITFSAAALTPDFSRLNPLHGLRRVWSSEGLAELARALLRVLLLGTVAVLALRQALPALLHLLQQPLPAALAAGARLILHLLLQLALALGVLAGADVVYQRWHYRRKLMMTRQELLEEYKETEGRPEIKAKIRRAQRELAQRRMMEDVPRADVVLVNPTHYAVALKYEAGRMRAPRLVAKGADEIARRIRETAERHGVPIVSVPPLARALYRQVDIGREIPVNLYTAVAQILGYVYQLRHWHRHGGRRPDLPDVTWPEE